MRLQVRAFVLLVLSLLATTIHSESPKAPVDAERLAALERFVVQWMADQRVPAITIGFFKDDYVWIKAYGCADVENDVPATIDSAYRLASVQKSMTAVAVLQLAEKGQLDLDADIRTYVPYYPAKKHPITARLLLGHLAGIPHYVDRDAEQHIKTHKTTREAIAIFDDFELLAEPGARYTYSSYGYNLLGAAIEGASQQSYADYMREHVWQPAGMQHTRLDDPLEIISRRVRGYQLVDGRLLNSEFIDVSSRFAAGGARGTVGDLLKFMIALNDGKLLSKSSLRSMVAPGTTKNGEPTPYALGWQIPPFEDRGTIVTNDGGQQETRTFILNEPGRNFGMALAMNLEANVYGPVVLKLYETVNGRPLRVRPARPAAQVAPPAARSTSH